jgi:POT family proton-dependent oligopeptide transporter
MATGFVMMSLSLAFAAMVQRVIYNTEPCYDCPLTCQGGQIPNYVNIFLQTLIYFILAVSEILGYVILAEYKYIKALTDMKAMVQALGQLW